MSVADMDSQLREKIPTWTCFRIDDPPQGHFADHPLFRYRCLASLIRAYLPIEEVVFALEEQYGRQWEVSRYWTMEAEYLVFLVQSLDREDSKLLRLRMDLLDDGLSLRTCTKNFVQLVSDLVNEFNSPESDEDSNSHYRVSADNVLEHLSDAAKVGSIKGPPHPFATFILNRWVKLLPNSRGVSHKPLSLKAFGGTTSQVRDRLVDLMCQLRFEREIAIFLHSPETPVAQIEAMSTVQCHSECKFVLPYTLMPVQPGVGAWYLFNEHKSHFENPQWESQVNIPHAQAVVLAYVAAMQAKLATREQNVWKTAKIPDFQPWKDNDILARMKAAEMLSRHATRDMTCLWEALSLLKENRFDLFARFLCSEMAQDLELRYQDGWLNRKLSTDRSTESPTPEENPAKSLIPDLEAELNAFVLEMGICDGTNWRQNILAWTAAVLEPDEFGQYFDPQRIVRFITAVINCAFQSDFEHPIWYLQSPDFEAENIIYDPKTDSAVSMNHMTLTFDPVMMVASPPSYLGLDLKSCLAKGGPLNSNLAELGEKRKAYARMLLGYMQCLEDVEKAKSIEDAGAQEDPDSNLVRTSGLGMRKRSVRWVRKTLSHRRK